MVEAKCQKCGGSATGSTFTEASAKINHAVGLSRGIKCGDNYGMVKEINADIVKNKLTPTVHSTIPKEIEPTPEPTPPPKKTKTSNLSKSTSTKFK